MIQIADRRLLVAGILMIVASVAAPALKPAPRPDAAQAAFDLEAVVPKSFGSWKVEDGVAPVVTNPEVEAQVKRLYQQTIGRTYVNDKGERVMLSLAYGGTQDRSLQVHRPEVCYAAQGFQILKQAGTTFQTKYGSFPVKRVVAQKGDRYEPITYWIVLGDEVTAGGLRAKLARLKYTLTGQVPDGMLVRVSTISPDEGVGYALQDQFSESMLAAMTTESRARLIGKLALQQLQ